MLSSGSILHVNIGFAVSSGNRDRSASLLIARQRGDVAEGFRGGPRSGVWWGAVGVMEEDTAKPMFTCKMLPLDSICYISVGMVAHADEKVAQGAFELDDLVSDTRDAKHPKPFVEGKHSIAGYQPTKMAGVGH